RFQVRLGLTVNPGCLRAFVPEHLFQCIADQASVPKEVIQPSEDQATATALCQTFLRSFEPHRGSIGRRGCREGLHTDHPFPCGLGANSEKVPAKTGSLRHEVGITPPLLTTTLPPPL